MSAYLEIMRNFTALNFTLKLKNPKKAIMQINQKRPAFLKLPILNLKLEVKVRFVS